MLNDIKFEKKALINFNINSIAAFLYFEIKTPFNAFLYPARDYLDMEIPILEAFIMAKDSSVIELPEGHYLFSQSLIMDGKKNVTIRRGRN